MGNAFKIGVDGGATQTRAILVDGSGAIVASVAAGGSNPNASSPAEAGAVCDTLLEALRGETRRLRGRVVRTLLCMAGDRDYWRTYAGRQKGLGRVAAADDSLPILELATNGRPGVVLHGGTGSFVSARTPDGAVIYAGGLGWRFGDEGGGYDLGRRAVAEAMLEAQRGGVPSAVGVLVRRQVGAATARELEQAYYAAAASPRFVAQLAGGLLDLAACNDARACRIVLASTSALLALGVQVAARHFPASCPVPLGLSGPILTHPFVASALQGLSPTPLRVVRGRPIEGIRRLLHRRSAPAPGERRRRLLRP